MYEGINPINCALQPIDGRAKHSVADLDPEGSIEYGSGSATLEATFEKSAKSNVLWFSNFDRNLYLPVRSMLFWI